MRAPSPLVLVVDDSPPQRYALARTLKHHGFQVLEAATGEEALKLTAEQRPDLVLLDVNLPDIDGFEVVRRLKENDRTSNIPVMHISASAVEQHDRRAGLAAGADAYLMEPVEPGELVANIRALLRMRDAEAGLQRTTATLAAVVEASPLPIVVFNRVGAVRTWNRAAEKLFGYTADEIIRRRDGSGTLAFLTAPPLLDRLSAGESLTGIEQSTVCKDGSAVELSIFAAPLERPASGEYVAILEDISGRKRYERERADLLARERDARREAEAASRLKDEFLATLSHELRTPLNAIMGWTSMLRQDTLDESTRRRALDIVDRNARSQQQLVSDILQVSQIIRGQLRLDMREVNVVEIIRSTIESVGPTAEAKHQSLASRLPAGAVMVSGDRERLQQVFWNLLTNAMKYTPRSGRIEVDVVEEGHEVSVSVRDTGVGIAPHVLPFIFERFRQGETGPTREYGGLGLGLAIVRHLTEAHGGSVRARSEGAGLGATFTVILPLLR